MACETSSDHVHIKMNDCEFNIVKVPETFSPTWSKKIGIEYNIDSGKIPNDEERASISELTSFLLGRQLLHIGHTSYYYKRVLEAVALNPWGDT